MTSSLIPVRLTVDQLKVLQTVFDQLCCDHLRDEGPLPYSFDDSEVEEFSPLLTIFEDELEKINA